MRLYFDLATGKLVQAAGYSSVLSGMAFKRGDAARLEISFTRGAVAAALTGTPTEMIFVVKKSVATTDVALLLADDWTLDEATGIWSAALPSDTVALTAQLGNSSYIDLLGEFSFTDEAGGPYTSQTVKVRVHNDLWKGNEATPLAQPAPRAWLEAELRSLGVLALLTRPMTDIFSVRMVPGEPLADWARGAKMLTTAAGGPTVSCVANTGYAKFLRWDGTYGAVSGDGHTTHSIPLTIGDAPASPYNSLMPKFMAVFPCDVGGVIGGDLTSLTAEGQQLTALDIRGLAELKTLKVTNNDLTYLDLGDQADLLLLDCSDNRLLALDVAAWGNMHSLDCSGNLLTTLDVSELPALAELHCENNLLTGVLAVESTALHEIYCSGNQLTGLDFGASVAVHHVECADNAITALDFAGLATMQILLAGNNALNEAAVDAAFLSLDAAALAGDPEHGMNVWTTTGNAAPSAASAARRAAMAGGWTITTD